MTDIKILPDGPYLVSGEVRVLDATGAEVSVAGRKAVALCRCGAAATKPFCDGSHGHAGFKDEGLAK